MDQHDDLDQLLGVLGLAPANHLTTAETEQMAATIRKAVRCGRVRATVIVLGLTVVGLMGLAGLLIGTLKLLGAI